MILATSKGDALSFFFKQLFPKKSERVGCVSLSGLQKQTETASSLWCIADSAVLSLWALLGEIRAASSLMAWLAGPSLV